MTKILVLYYSRHGHVAEMAKLIAKGASQMSNCEVSIRHCCRNRRRPRRRFRSADICSAAKMTYVLAMDSRWAQPTRFGNMAAPLKAFIDTTSDVWISGSMIDKPACVFTASSSMHGGARIDASFDDVTVIAPWNDAPRPPV